DEYTIGSSREDYVALLANLQEHGQSPSRIIHLFSLTEAAAVSGIDSFKQMQELGYYSLLFLAQALGERGAGYAIDIWTITNGLYEVESGDISIPEKAPLLGPIKVIPQEYQNVSCRCIDVRLPGSEAQREELTDQLITELTGNTTDVMIALRSRL